MLFSVNPNVQLDFCNFADDSTLFACGILLNQSFQKLKMVLIRSQVA